MGFKRPQVQIQSLGPRRCLKTAKQAELRQRLFLSTRDIQNLAKYLKTAKHLQKKKKK